MSRSSPKACRPHTPSPSFYPTAFGMGTSYVELTHSLTDAFNTLADEAQGLNDRRIVLEHKLRFAHEQVGLATLLFSWLRPLPPFFFLSVLFS